MSLMRIAALAVAALILHLVLILPNHPGAVTARALTLFPLELPVILLALMALHRRAARMLRVPLVAVLVALVVVRLADLATFAAYDRPFDVAVDLHLLHAAWTLATGSFGLALTLAGAVAAVAALIVLAAALWWATRQWAMVRTRGAARALAAVAAVAALVVAVAEIGQVMRGWRLPADPPGAAFAARVGTETVLRARATGAALDEFRTAARDDPMAARGAPPLDALDGTDVLVTFVESYGRSSFDNPLYRDTHAGTLRAIEARLGDADVAMRSGWLTAPMAGGQSWLAHASVASGMWISDQGRYRALLASPRRTLFHFAQDAGYRTAAVMPAHTRAWPEGDYFGFDAIYNASDLGYAGQPYNWVTMPDQFTMAALDRLERDTAERPVFAQIALVSSHAPFLPVPPLIDWDEVGDGAVFDEWADDGAPPSEVWRDHDRVRDKFRRAVDYSLGVVGAYAERHADDPPLMIVLGDHEPARFIAGIDGYDVPVHIIGPPELVERIAGWGYTEGLVPGDDAPVWRMDAFRDRFLSAFSSEAS